MGEKNKVREIGKEAQQGQLITKFCMEQRVASSSVFHFLVPLSFYSLLLKKKTLVVYCITSLPDNFIRDKYGIRDTLLVAPTQVTGLNYPCSEAICY